MFFIRSFLSFIFHPVVKPYIFSSFLIKIIITLNSFLFFRRRFNKVKPLLNAFLDNSKSFITFVNNNEDLEILIDYKIILSQFKMIFTAL